MERTNDEVDDFLEMMLANQCDENESMAAETDLSKEYIDQRFTESLIPSVGMEFNSAEEAWNFWQSYARRKGFSARKHYRNKDKDDVVTSEGFVCNKESYQGKDKRDPATNEGRAETRNGCLACMVVKLLRKTRKYIVTHFVTEHNHDLHKLKCVHMMRSQRKIEDVQAFEVELADDAGLTQKLSHDYFGIQAGGRENLGFLQLDESELITNIFWADAKMRIDYELFGEVITFDTTFSTNKEYRPLGVFVGFNHHREMVIFGAALLYDETANSFAWLFEKFLEAQKLKKPQTIFTDQDAAMAKALCEVMPETWHGLCTWHLMQNGIKHLGNLMKDGSHFLTDLKKLMYEYEEESQFEEAWNALLDFYNAHENSWLNKMYKLKEKWGKCFMKTIVTIGMRSTQLSESLNGYLKDYLRSNIDIISFFKHFERIVSEKRYKEKLVEYGATEKLPRMRVKTLPLLQQAGKVYTPLIFEMFQEEWEKNLPTIVK